MVEGLGWMDVGESQLVRVGTEQHLPGCGHTVDCRRVRLLWNLTDKTFHSLELLRVPKDSSQQLWEGTTLKQGLRTWREIRV